MVRDLLTRRRFLAAPAALVVFGGGVLLTGCTSPLVRSQAEDEAEPVPYDVRTVGDVAGYGNARPIPVGGVGLVTDLEGTGGECPKDMYREMLEDELRKARVPNIKALMTSRECAVVHLQAFIPPGARKGDPIDVEVSLPPGSKATSLRGGYLRECKLFNYDTAKNLSPDYKGGDQLMKGHPVARAEGVVMVELGREGEDFRGRGGRVWGGGTLAVENPFTLLMKPDNQFVKITAPVADRVNTTFHGHLKEADGSTGKLAHPQNHVAVALRVPPCYRHNHPRYLRVVRLIPMRDDADAPTAAGKSYRQRLAEDLLDPARTVTAALRLEALGQSSVPALKQGLTGKHPLVRFCAAEALAYLGSPSCADELAACVRDEPRFRAFALTAMASVEDGVCQLKLREILESADDDEVRYGAFRALRSVDERDPAVSGRLVNESFWLHRVAPGTAPLVHVSSSKRPEVVLFGDGAALRAPFALLAGNEFTVTAAAGSEHCTVTRRPVRGEGGPPPKQCGLDLGEVIRTMAAMGAMYPEVVEVLQQAHAEKGLSCRVRVDALPQALTVYELADLGKGAGKKGGGADADLGVTPTLYERGTAPRSVAER